MKRVKYGEETGTRGSGRHDERELGREEREKVEGSGRGKERMERQAEKRAYDRQ